MKVSVASMIFHEYSLCEIFDAIQISGLDSVEFWPETPDFWLNGKNKDYLKNCLKDHPMFFPITFHAPVLDLNPCSLNAEIAEISIQNTFEAIDLARELGASVVTIHPGRRTVKRPPSAADYERFHNYIKRIKDSGASETIKIAIENMAPAINSLLADPEDLLDLLNKEKWLYFTLDTSHALSVSPDQVLRYISLCGHRLANVHLSYASEGSLHLALGNENIFKEIISEIIKSGYNGHLTLEIEDTHFSHTLSYEEKILMLRKENEFIDFIIKRKCN